MQSATELTLEQRTQTLGPDNFANLMPRFEDVHLISKLQSERLTNEALRNQWLYPGDGLGYGLKDANVMLYLTDFPNNPLMKNPEEVARELTSKKNFFFNGADLEARATSQKGVVAFNLSLDGFKKHLQRYDNEFSYIEVSTAKLAEGRESFKQEYGNEVTALFDRLHGDAIYGTNGIGAMLKQKEKDTTRIWLVNPDYVKSTIASKQKGTMVARASYLGGFGDRSVVVLDDWDVDGRGHVRGVVKETAEGGAQKITQSPAVQTAQQVPMPYDDALKLAAERYAPPTSPLFQVFKGFLDTVYRRK